MDAVCCQGCHVARSDQAQRELGTTWVPKQSQERGRKQGDSLLYTRPESGEKFPALASNGAWHLQKRFSLQHCSACKVVVHGDLVSHTAPSGRMGIGQKALDAVTRSRTSRRSAGRAHSVVVDEGIGHRPQKGVR